MVGHTGVIPAAVKAVRDRRQPPRRGDRGGAKRRRGRIITADHGNCDAMLEPDGSPNTAHSLNPVPLIVTHEGLRLRERRHPRRRRADRFWPARHRPTAGDERPLADRVREDPGRLRFEIEARDGAARAGTLHTSHGPIQTPAFIPLATKATVRGLDSERGRRRSVMS